MHLHSGLPSTRALPRCPSPHSPRSALLSGDGAGRRTPGRRAISPLGSRCTCCALGARRESHLPDAPGGVAEAGGRQVRRGAGRETPAAVVAAALDAVVALASDACAEIDSPRRSLGEDRVGPRVPRLPGEERPRASRACPLIEKQPLGCTVQRPTDAVHSSLCMRARACVSAFTFHSW